MFKVNLVGEGNKFYGKENQRLNSMCEVVWSIKWKVRDLTLGPKTTRLVLFGPLCSTLGLSVLPVQAYKRMFAVLNMMKSVKIHS